LARVRQQVTSPSVNDIFLSPIFLSAVTSERKMGDRKMSSLL
jgi:hypothetical protein